MLMVSRDDQHNGIQYSLVADALPDLVIGLVGIPVAFALQEIASSALARSTITIMEWRSYGSGVFFVVGIYALYSVALLLIFEQSARTTREPSYLLLLVPSNAALAMIMTGIVVAAGKLYSNPYWQPLLIDGALIVLTLVPLVSVAVSRGEILKYLLEQRRTASLLYMLAFLLFLTPFYLLLTM